MSYMAADSYVIRNYSPADRERFVLFLGDAESVCGSRDDFFLASLAGQAPSAPSPIDFSAADLFLAEEGERIIGSCRVVPELAIDRAVLRLFHAPHVPVGESTIQLLNAAVGRAYDLKAGRVQADLKADEQVARNLFEDIGFRPVRQYTDMAANLDSMSIIEADNKGLTYRALEPGQESEFTQLQNQVFEGSWGFCPNTTDQIIRQLSTPGYGHDGVILAHKEKKTSGYCWTVIAKSAASLKRTGPIGRIHMMGVIPELRGQGLGKHILRSGLRQLSSKSVGTVELTVDNENAPAYSLYRSAGFEPKTSLVWYEKRAR